MAVSLVAIAAGAVLVGVRRDLLRAIGDPLFMAQSLGALALGALGVQTVCPISRSAHILVAHVLPVVVLALTGCGRQTDVRAASHARVSVRRPAGDEWLKARCGPERAQPLSAPTCSAGVGGWSDG